MGGPPLASLRGEFIERTVLDMQQLRREFRRWCVGRSESLTEVRTVAHRICGGAGMFGFADVARAARPVEAYAARILRGEVDRSSEVNDQLEAAVRRLEEVLASGLAAP